MQTTTRNADLSALIDMLRTQHARKVDVVAPARAITSENGRLLIRGAEQQITMEGVTTTDGTYVPTTVCDEGLADKLGVPVAYLKRLRTDRPDLYDANVNGWLHGADRLLAPRILTTAPDGRLESNRTVLREGHPEDGRNFLVRCFRGDDGDGIARAFLSDRYAPIDNLDVLMATLDGIREAGVQVNVDGGDITERRMVVRVSAPEVQALAPVLLRGYRSPFTGQSGDDNPTVWAGFQISNSEVGGGAYTITPRLVVQVCKNGMTITRDAVQKVHLGGRLDTGVVKYAEDTQTAALDLVQKQTRDAVATFLSPEYLTGAITALEARAEEPVADHEQVKVLTRGLRYSDEDMAGILAQFTRGGQMTRGGVVNAITAHAQTVDDGENAYDLEARAVSLLI